MMNGMLQVVSHFPVIVSRNGNSHHFFVIVICLQHYVYIRPVYSLIDIFEKANGELPVGFDIPIPLSFLIIHNTTLITLFQAKK
jgi:hypothetical protein